MQNNSKEENFKDGLGSNELSINLKFGNTADFMNFCTEIAGNNLSPLKAPKDIAIAILAGHALSISIPAALNHIVPINGRATLSNQLSNALLIKGGVITEILEDAQPLYPVFYYDYNDSFEIKRTPDGQPIINEVKLMFKSDIDKLIADWKQLSEDNLFNNDKEKDANKPKVSWRPIHKGTRVRLTRSVRQLDGSYKDVVVVRDFTTAMADKIVNKEGDSVRITKDSWRNYEDDMLFANAWRRCARVLGSDLTLGLYGTEEMLDTTNINYTMREDEVVILDKDNNVVKQYNANKVTDSDINK